MTEKLEAIINEAIERNREVYTGYTEKELREVVFEDIRGVLRYLMSDVAY